MKLLQYSFACATLELVVEVPKGKSQTTQIPVWVPLVIKSREFLVEVLKSREFLVEVPKRRAVLIEVSSPARF